MNFVYISSCICVYCMYRTISLSRWSQSSQSNLTVTIKCFQFTSHGCSALSCCIAANVVISRGISLLNDRTHLQNHQFGISFCRVSLKCLAEKHLEPSCHHLENLGSFQRSPMFPAPTATIIFSVSSVVVCADIRYTFSPFRILVCVNDKTCFSLPQLINCYVYRRCHPAVRVYSYKILE